jgi:hypothetical protein
MLKRILIVVGVIALGARILVVQNENRHRGAGTETTTIGRMRELMAAQAAYAQMSGGYYARVECLVEPGGCGFAARRPLLEPAFLQTERGGYNFEVRLGPDAKSYAYVALPRKGFFGRRTNSFAVRAFCADATQRICSTPDGSAPAEAGGRCGSSCPDLR